ncbi:MAG: hypothetical protein AAF587_32070 [Bacteroidota bacterium]
MNKKIALAIAILGIIILMIQIGLTAKNQSANYFFLAPIGLFLTMGAAAYIIIQGRKQDQ